MMQVLLLSGLGPQTKYENIFDDTALALQTNSSKKDLVGSEVLEWSYLIDGCQEPLLRPRGIDAPNLTTSLLHNLFEIANCDVTAVDLSYVWSDYDAPATCEKIDFIALSSTYICNFRVLRKVLKWIRKYYCGKPLVIGGQFSNLKAEQIIRSEPDVTCIVRGDGELTIPALVRAFRGEIDWDDVPNIVSRQRDSTQIKFKPLEYCDLNFALRPQFPEGSQIVPYESMRGCPFICQFCSFPAASPKWRYKSVATMLRDFDLYEAQGVHHIRAMDSTFSVPGKRFRDFVSRKARSSMSWECYSRANAVAQQETVSALEDASLSALSIGFESMSDGVLRKMRKGVESKYNRIAGAVLENSEIATRVSFMIGYPGETPDDFLASYRYLVDEFSLRFMISVFSPLDETMPVWQQQADHGLEILDNNDAEPRWRHNGMTSDEAVSLLHQTVKDARWSNEAGTHLLWQASWEKPLMRNKSRKLNQRVEKLIERFVFAPKDFSTGRTAKTKRKEILHELQKLGVITGLQESIPI